MTPIIDNWVLIVDGNNYTIARYFGEKTDKNGKTYKDIRDAKYYTSLVACRETGHKYVGFEIDKEYYNMASERLKAAEQQVNIFDFMGND